MWIALPDSDAYSRCPRRDATLCLDSTSSTRFQRYTEEGSVPEISALIYIKGRTVHMFIWIYTYFVFRDCVNCVTSSKVFKAHTCVLPFSHFEISKLHKIFVHICRVESGYSDRRVGSNTSLYSFAV